jgi:hypothetical protein
MDDASLARSQSPITVERPYWIGWWNAIVLAAVITSGATPLSAQRFPFGRLGAFDFIIVRPGAVFLAALLLVISVASIVLRFRPNRWVFDGQGWTDERPMGVSGKCVEWESVVEAEMTSGSFILSPDLWPSQSIRLSVSYESASGSSTKTVNTSEVHGRALSTLVDQLAAHVPPERIDGQVLCYGSDPTVGRRALNAYLWRVVSVGLVLGVGVVAAMWWWFSTM